MFVFSNLAISIDGKIATTSREHFPLGTPADRKLMQKLRARSDAIVIGAGTLRAWRRPLLVLARKKQPMNVIISSTLEGISPVWPFFTDPRTRKAVFVSDRAPEARVRRLTSAMGGSGEIYVLKKTSTAKRDGIATQVITHLARLGVQRLLVEGGGGLMWDFIRHNLIDEMYLTLTPRIVGGVQAPTLVDGPGFSPSQIVNFKLKSYHRLGHELYLVYSKTSFRRNTESSSGNHAGKRP